MAFLRIGNPYSCSLTAAGPFRICTGFPVCRKIQTNFPATSQTNALFYRILPFCQYGPRELAKGELWKELLIWQDNLNLRASFKIACLS
jgi:hypothetical protein